MQAHQCCPTETARQIPEASPKDRDMADHASGFLNEKEFKYEPLDD
jgi:hypothetical protein